MTAIDYEAGCTEVIWINGLARGGKPNRLARFRGFPAASFPLTCAKSVARTRPTVRFLREHRLTTLCAS